jgi:integrase
MGVRDRGNSILLEFTYRGIRRKPSLKLTPTKANLKYAENKHAVILYEIATDTFDFSKHFPNYIPKDEPSANSRSKIIKDALLSYLVAMKRTLTPSAYASYESAVRCHLIPNFGHLKIVDLTTQEIRQWRGGLTISNKRINNILIPLRSIFEDAFADGAIDRNPLARIKSFEVIQKDPEPFTFEEQQRILAALPDQEKNLIQFAFWTGLRTSELIALEWGDIDRVRGTAYVQRACVRGILKYPKTRSGKREVLLLPEALEALENQKAFTFKKGKHIFHNPVTDKAWSSDVKIRNPLWKNALKAAGVRYRNPYQTRHTYASMLLSAGENPAWIARQMGHTNMNMVLQKYGRYLPDHDPLAGQKIIARMSQNGHKMVTKWSQNGGRNEKAPQLRGLRWWRFRDSNARS